MTAARSARIDTVALSSPDACDPFGRRTASTAR